MKNTIEKLYRFLLQASPWAFLAGLFHFHFQNFLPYQRIFRGLQFFDFITVLDLFVGFLLVVFLLGYLTNRIQFVRKKIPMELLLCIGLLLFGGILQFIFQQTLIEPILSTPTEYFRSFFVFPLIYAVLLYKTADEHLINRVVKSYLFMVGFFSALALLQYTTGIFPGEQKDFMGRLVWPFIDFVTFKSSSANWAAFFLTPAFILSFTHFFCLLRERKDTKKRLRSLDTLFLAIAFLLTGTVLYLTQSYGAYMAVFSAILLYLFRALKWKKFLMAAVIMTLLAGGAFMLQKNTWKFQVFTGSTDYRFENSVTSRFYIYTMDLEMIKERPLLGVGLNQFQSYFFANQQRILGHEMNQAHVPPHAHNFFLSFYTNLGFAGFLAMLILVLGIFWRTRLKSDYPAVFVLLAIMIHGLVDSYYWKQEIAYTFWFVVVMAYLYRANLADKTL